MATLIKERSTYWVRSGGSSHDSTSDYRGYWKIYYEQSSSDKALLRTKITVQYYIQTYVNNEGYLPYLPSSVSLNSYVNGTSLGSLTATNLPANPGTNLKSVGSKTTYVYHNSDGTCSFTWKGTGGGLSTSVTTYSVPKYDVGTTITNNTSESSRIDFNSNVTFSLTTPNSANNYLYYSVNGTNYDITSSSGSSSSSITYAFPSSLINSFPNNSDVAIIVNCKNLTSNVITTTTVYLHVPNNILPTISSLVLNKAGDVPSAWNIWVKGKSKINGIITASGSSGSTISSYYTRANDSTYSTASFTTGYLSSPGTMTVSSTVTDSRGRTASASQSISVVDYSTPSLSAYKIVRCDANGNEDNFGTYGKVVCTYAISNCSNNNSKTLKVTVNGTTKTISLSSYSGTYTSPSNNLFSGISTSNSYSCTFKICDYFNEISYTYTISPSYETVSKYHGGTGITFGQVATQSGFHDYMGATFHNGLNVIGNLQKNGNSVALASDIPTKTSDLTNDSGFGSTVGTSGIWTYIKFNNGYAICWGVYSISTKINETWGNGYLAGAKTPPNFPFTFVEVPKVIKTMTNSDVNQVYAAAITSVGANDPATASYPGGFDLFRATSLSTAQNFGIAIVAFGKWR